MMGDLLSFPVNVKTAQLAMLRARHAQLLANAEKWKHFKYAHDRYQQSAAQLAKSIERYAADDQKVVG